MSGAIRYRNRNIRINQSMQQAHPPAPFFFDDFLGDTLAATYWLLTQSGTPTTAGAISVTAGDPVAGHGGWFAGATDDVDAEADELAVMGTAAAGQFRADQAGSGLLVCEWAISVPTALTARQYFAGVSDDATEGSGAIAINVTTTTVADAASDAAGFCFGSAATDNTHWLGVSTDSNAESTITQGATAAADTWIGLRVEIDAAGNVFYGTRANRGGVVTIHGASDTGISPDVLVSPYFGASPTTTTAVPWEIDYAFISCGNVTS